MAILKIADYHTGFCSTVELEGAVDPDTFFPRLLLEGYIKAQEQVVVAVTKKLDTIISFFGGFLFLTALVTSLLFENTHRIITSQPAHVSLYGFSVFFLFLSIDVAALLVLMRLSFNPENKRIRTAFRYGRVMKAFLYFFLTVSLVAVVLVAALILTLDLTEKLEATDTFAERRSLQTSGEIGFYVALTRTLAIIVCTLLILLAILAMCSFAGKSSKGYAGIAGMLVFSNMLTLDDLSSLSFEVFEKDLINSSTSFFLSYSENKMVLKSLTLQDIAIVKTSSLENLIKEKAEKLTAKGAAQVLPISF